MNSRRSPLAWLLCALLTLAAHGASAQTWPVPAKTQNTEVPCPKPACSTPGLVTLGYGSPLLTFTGRYLSSETVRDFQRPYRTARARTMSFLPPGVSTALPNGRLYMQIGEGLAAYNADRFIDRLQAGEERIAATGIPTTERISRPTGSETLLLWDSWFYPEFTNSGWTVFQIDGQDRLYGFDWDDRGNVYLAYSVFGWGIVKDDGQTDATLMPSVYQDLDAAGITPHTVVAAKGTDHYYALICGGGGLSAAYDVTNPAAPTLIGKQNRGIYAFARNTALNRIGVVDTNGGVAVFTADALATGGSPIISLPAPAGGQYQGIASDGTNFFAAAQTPNGLLISTFKLSGSGYTATSMQTADPMFSIWHANWGAGFLTVTGQESSAWEVRVFKTASSPMSEISLNHYVPGYYYAAPSAKYATPPTAYINLYDSLIYQKGTKNYLIVAAKGLGDVYEFDGGNSLIVTPQGDAGTANPNTPATSAGPFYGDKLRFVAAGSQATASQSIQWNFGNAEASGDANVVAGVTGTSVVHQYSGIAPGGLGAQRVVTATSTADSSVTGSTFLHLKSPAPRIGISGTGKIITGSGTGFSLVAGDRFVDASDGDVEGHYASWTIDGTTTSALPTTAVSAGACSTTHVLSFDGHYGPYSNQFATIGPDYAVGIHGLPYAVRPFVAEIGAPSSDATNVTFSSLSRVTTDTSIVAAPASISYRWELVDAQNAALLAGPSGTASPSAIPSWPVAKSVFNARGIRAHLVLTSPTPLAGSCAGMEMSDGFTAALNGPDPVLVGGCTNGGAPCTFSISSAAGTDIVADGWNIQWTASGPGQIIALTNTGATYSPTFTAAGNYTISALVTNSVGSKTVAKAESVTVVNNCPAMSDVDPYIDFHGATSGCSQNSPNCSASESIAFRVTGFNYPMSCGPHTFQWSFDDGGSGMTQSLNHAFATAGTHSISVVVNNGTQSITLHSSVIVGSINSLCTLTKSAVFIKMSGESSHCSEGSPACIANELIDFSAGTYLYDFAACGNHTFVWNFGDGSASVSGTNPKHAFAPSSTPYTVSLTVTNSTSSVTVTQVVSFEGPPPLCTLSSNNVFVKLTGSASGCTSASPNCKGGEAINFALGTFGYNLASCGPHIYEWDFGDGSAKVNDASPSHVFTSAKTYNVQLRVTNAISSIILTQAVTIQDGCPPLSANNVFVQYSGSKSSCDQQPGSKGCGSGETIVFSPGAFQFVFECQPLTFTWDFGDGSPVSNLRSAMHTYESLGNYAVKLTVSTTGGVSFVYPATVRVDHDEHPVHITVVLAFKVFAVGSVKNGYSFQATADPASNSISSWVWDFGDGHVETGGSQITHTFADSKNYTVTVTARDSGGVTVGIAAHPLFSGRPRPSRGH